MHTPVAGSPRWSRYVPWRSAALGWLVAAVALAAGVPLFLRMPPWCDLTLYDVAAHNVLRGGTHYRDVFDTNPPGFVLCLTAVRAVFGDSFEAVRAVDLGVVAVIVLLLARWVRRAGGTAASVAWMAAGVALFYPSTSEFNHCQRDVWMLLPVAAVGLHRLRRTARPAAAGRFLLEAAGEGLVLGLAAWLKPHALFPAAAVWLVTLPRVAGQATPPGRPWRAAGLDFLGNFGGGLAALGLGIAWLVGTGAWPSFLEVFTFWNPGYLRMVLSELDARADGQFTYFPPWSLFQPFALLLAAVAVARGGWWRGPPPAPEAAPADRGAGLARAALAALFLAWTAQGLFLQRAFPYVHVPETLLMLAVFAAHRYAAGFAGLVVVAAGSVATAAARDRPEWAPEITRFQRRYPTPGQIFTRHPLTEPDRLTRWPDCWRFDLSPAAALERRNAVGFQVNYFAGVDWVQLGQVADFLTADGPPRDGEVLAWHDSPHAVYLLLHVRPGFRFMHVSTLTGIGDPQYERVQDELHAATDGPGGRVKWVVADLERVFDRDRPGDPAAMAEPGPGAGDLLPPALRAWFPNVAAEFPFDLPAAFRSADGRGRYVVFRRTGPITPECRIPMSLGIDLPPTAE